MPELEQARKKLPSRRRRHRRSPRRQTDWKLIPLYGTEWARRATWVGGFVRVCGLEVFQLSVTVFQLGVPVRQAGDVSIGADLYHGEA